MAAPTVPRTAPPPIGRNMTVRTTRDMHDDLAVLLTPGGTLADVVRQAIRQAADIHRTAWAHGVCEPGTAPVLAAYSLHAQPGYEPPAEQADAPGQLVTPPPYPAAGHTVTTGHA